MPLPKGAAEIYSNKQIDGNTTTNETNPVSVVGIVQVVRPDPERTFLLILNLSTNDMYLGLSEEVSASNGILLAANGGFVKMQLVDDFELLINPFYVFSSAAGNQLYVLQTRRQTKPREEA